MDIQRQTSTQTLIEMRKQKKKVSSKIIWITADLFPDWVGADWLNRILFSSLLYFIIWVIIRTQRNHVDLQHDISALMLNLLWAVNRQNIHKSILRPDNWIKKLIAGVLGPNYTKWKLILVSALLPLFLGKVLRQLYLSTDHVHQNITEKYSLQKIYYPLLLHSLHSLFENVTKQQNRYLFQVPIFQVCPFLRLHFMNLEIEYCSLSLLVLETLPIFPLGTTYNSTQSYPIGGSPCVLYKYWD